MSKKKIEVAVYKGEEILCMGTVSKCAEKLGLKESTIHFYLSPAYKKRLATRISPNCIDVVRINDDEK